MKTIAMNMNLQNIDALRIAIAARQAQMDEMVMRIEEIRKAAPSMNLAELLNAKAEVFNMHTMLNEHAVFIERAKKTIAEYYKPAVA